MLNRQKFLLNRLTHLEKITYRFISPLLDLQPIKTNNIHHDYPILHQVWVYLVKAWG